MGDAAKWRRANIQTQTATSRERFGLGTHSTPDESLRCDDQHDRLLLSALKYWEVERDLIEERLAHQRGLRAAAS